MSKHHDLPTLPHHFITGKTRIMFIFFIVVLLIAIGSYIYLLSKTNELQNTAHQANPTPSVSPTQSKPVMQSPKEFSDENISFFYPDVLVIDDTQGMNVTWDMVVSGTILTGKAMQLQRQSIPFSPPNNTDYSNSKYFSIDDQEERDLNDITVMEYTVNCGVDCYYRVDQFRVSSTYYQLSFNIAGGGLSQRAEQILATLRLLIPTPTITQGIKACTQEAKLCSDGSYVGRSGPNCDFAACPQ